ncbi:MAG: DNA helicase RecQ [candidate division WOR-3 bacterium]|nr:DNA helicase RecQ [candidate division WOR-3 bacterium]
MRIVVNHVTRMQPGFVCVAGLDSATGRHVRPELPGRVRIDMLGPNGGPFDMAVEVELGQVKPHPSPPEVEDCLVTPSALRKVRDLPADEFWRLLKSVARPRLVEVFGAGFCRHGNTWIIEPGTGEASLGCLLPQAPPLLEVCVEDYQGQPKQRIRCHVRDRDGECFPPVTDLRLYCADQKTPRHELVADLNRRMKAGASAILSVGVTRAMGQGKHWLQVNNLHLSDNPIWRLPAAPEEAEQPVGRMPSRARDHAIPTGRKPPGETIPDGAIEAALRKYWGYERFLPLQREAIECAVAGQDSVVVLPTGGGKSLCYQVPAVTMPGLAVVVSPLISLMKDQVDGLAECGIPAARLDSSLSYEERTDVLSRMRRQALKLLYVAPERLVMDDFVQLLRNVPISLFAIDEAHCISIWGHDFRPEYRQLGTLKELFPDTAVHAYTATATEKVRQDIAEQLRLERPTVIVGSFDRPNLVYQTQRRHNVLAQVSAVIDRHQNESGIIYCIRRTDVDELCADLAGRGYAVTPYHAGMNNDDRKRSQDAFFEERANTMVATIAFGMGIDKSNVRYVVHAGMPKSLEHYHQESGRAGRDGLEAECCIFYSGADYATWQMVMRDMEPAPKATALEMLNLMYGYCTGVTCRHRALLAHFGQELEARDCQACDVCLGNLDCIEDPLPTAQTILSCVLQLGERFGGDYTSRVLTGSREERILANCHDKLSTHGLLSRFSKRVVRDWVEQLAAQGCIDKVGEYNVLKVTESGRQVLKGRETPRLLRPAEKKARKARAAAIGWQGVDEGLFEELRKLRRRLSEEKHVPAFVVFSDATLRDMARLKPMATEDFLEVNGVGEKKCEQYAQVFLHAIAQYCRLR